jgi:hypothetical protein
MRSTDFGILLTSCPPPLAQVVFVSWNVCTDNLHGPSRIRAKT